MERYRIDNTRIVVNIPVLGTFRSDLDHVNTNINGPFTTNNILNFAFNDVLQIGCHFGNIHIRTQDQADLDLKPFFSRNDIRADLLDLRRMNNDTADQVFNSGK